MNYLILDTSIIVHILKNSPVAQKVIKEHNLYDENTIPVISSVTKGELLSFVKQRKWGEQKIKLLDNFLKSIVFIDVNFNSDDLQSAYANIDAYSKRKINSPDGKLLNGSSIKMGKNDLWISATSYVLNAPLITTDKDFNHLDNVYIKLKLYSYE